MLRTAFVAMGGTPAFAALWTKIRNTDATGSEKGLRWLRQAHRAVGIASARLRGVQPIISGGFASAASPAGKGTVPGEGNKGKTQDEEDLRASMVYSRVASGKRRGTLGLSINKAQEDYWKSSAGLKWIEHEHALREHTRISASSIERSCTRRRHLQTAPERAETRANEEAKPIEVWLAPPDGARGAARAASRVGPAARIIKAHSGGDADARKIEDVVCKAFGQFEHGDHVRVPAVVNLFTCHRFARQQVARKP